MLQRMMAPLMAPLAAKYYSPLSSNTVQRHISLLAGTSTGKVFMVDLETRRRVFSCDTNSAGSSAGSPVNCIEPISQCDTFLTGGFWFCFISILVIMSACKI